MAETKLDWTLVLPLALMSMRGRPRGTTGLSPHNVMTSRPMETGLSPTSCPNEGLVSLEQAMISYTQGVNHHLAMVCRSAETFKDGAITPWHPLRHLGCSMRAGLWCLLGLSYLIVIIKFSTHGHFHPQTNHSPNLTQSINIHLN